MSKFLRGFQFAYSGLVYMFRTQLNAKVHLIAAALAVGLAFYFNIELWEWIAIVICIAIVLAAEAFNTAIEKMVDELSPGYNSAAGKVKDISAAAVLILASGAAIVGTIIFYPKIFCV